MDTEEIRKKVLQCVENTADANLLHSMLNLVEGRAGYSRNRLGIYNDRIGDDIRIDTNMIVPIICDDMFEVYDEKSEVWCSINDFVCSRYEVDDVIAEAIRSNFYYGMTLLEQLRNDYSRDLYDTLQGKLEKGNLRLRSTVREFLQHGNFPLIVTTFGFRVIEESLTRYKDGDRWFNPTVRNDIPFMHKDSWIVYHIFGGKEYSHWVYDEQEMLGFMLKQEINNKISLGIGEDGQFAHKTGEYFELANHDMGIVYMKGHHDYSICCFSGESKIDEALNNMKEISEIVYNYFETT